MDKTVVKSEYADKNGGKFELSKKALVKRSSKPRISPL